MICPVCNKEVEVISHMKFNVPTKVGDKLVPSKVIATSQNEMCDACKEDIKKKLNV